MFKSARCRFLFFYWIGIKLYTLVDTSLINIFKQDAPIIFWKMYETALKQPTCRGHIFHFLLYFSKWTYILYNVNQSFVFKNLHGCDYQNLILGNGPLNRTYVTFEEQQSFNKST